MPDYDPVQKISIIPRGRWWFNLVYAQPDGFRSVQPLLSRKSDGGGALVGLLKS